MRWLENTTNSVDMNVYFFFRIKHERFEKIKLKVLLQYINIVEENVKIMIEIMHICIISMDFPKLRNSA